METRKKPDPDFQPRALFIEPHKMWISWGAMGLILAGTAWGVTLLNDIKWTNRDNQRVMGELRMEIKGQADSLRADMKGQGESLRSDMQKQSVEFWKVKQQRSFSRQLERDNPMVNVPDVDEIISRVP
jgi:hypothetical protein